MASRSGHGRSMAKQAGQSSEQRRRSAASTKEGRSRARHVKAMSMPPVLATETIGPRPSSSLRTGGGPGRPLSVISSSSTVMSRESSSSNTSEWTKPEPGRPSLYLQQHNGDAFVRPMDRSYRRRTPPAAMNGAQSPRFRPGGRPSLSARNSSTRISLRQKPKSFVYRNGRRYLHDCRYMLPHDLQELQRQNLSTILTTTVLGSPLRIPIDPLDPPKKILEVGCADGFWSSLCHEFFVCLGLPPPAFTGLDIAREGPDLRRFGIDWTYVTHDLNIRPLPFDNDSFDVVMSKDMTIAISFEAWWLLLPELLRILRPGGYLEFRDRDYTFRRMMAPPRVPIESSLEDAMIARESGCYHIMPGSEFTECENEYLRDVSEWTHRLMESRGQHSTPMRALEGIESWFGWEQFEVRRIAIPLCPMTNWERNISSTFKGESVPLQLDIEQQALRATALEVILGFIQSLEPLLRKVCGKNEEEWRRWWNFMVTDLVEDDGAATGECLEIGVAWGRKEVNKRLPPIP